MGRRFVPYPNFYNMKKASLMLLASIITLSFTSCNEDDTKEAMPNVYEGFIVTPANPAPGDSITITAKVACPGQYLYDTRYSWNLKVNTPDGDKQSVASIKIDGDGSQYRDAVWKTRIDPAAYSGQAVIINFSAKWRNATDGAVTGNFTAPRGEGCIGSISSTVSTIYSHAKGSCTIHLK